MPSLTAPPASGILSQKAMESAQPPSAFFYFLTFAILLALSAFFSASESAFLSSSRLHLRYLRERGDKRAARSERILKDKSRFLNAILIGNNVVNIALSSIATALAVSIAGTAGVGIATAAASVAILIFGEIIPKATALSSPERFTLRLSRPLSMALALLYPAALAFSLLSRALERLIGVGHGERSGAVTEDDVRALIEVGEEEGMLEAADGTIMQKILDSTDLTARDIMTPRTSIAAVPMEATKEEMLSLSLRTSFSRLPVYGSGIDDIRGVAHVKDIFLAGLKSPAGGEPSTGDITAKDIMRPAPFVFESQRIPALQRLLHEQNSNCAIVIDEFGGTSGLVSMEDIFEEIFGSIRDEYDAPEPEGREAREDGKPAGGGVEQDAEADGPREFYVPGTARIEEVSQRAGIAIESSYYDTIAGYLMELSGDIPRSGYRHVEQGVSFTVMATTGNRIDEIRVAREGDDE